MRKPFPLIFDMDDTKCDTNTYMLAGLSAYFGERKDGCPIHHAIYLLLQQEGVSTIRIGRLLDKYAPEYAKLYHQVCMDQLLITGDFILQLEPIADMLNYIKNELAEHIRNGHVVCYIGTHRGFCSVGEANTLAWLEKHNCSHLFERVFVLDPKTHPDKRVVFGELFGEDYLLIDDNPCKTDPGYRCKQLLVSEQLHPVLDHLKGQSTFCNARELNAHLIELGIIPNKL